MTLVRAKKHLGQHFLTDLSVARRIADSLPADCTLPILEVGPGMGVLSQFVVEKPNRFTAVEIDSESVEYLRQYLPALDVVEGDFLKMNLDRLFEGAKFAVIGNFPYNISSQIFFRVLDHRDRIPCIVGMVQKEVALRMAAKPSSKDYGAITVLCQYYTEPSVVTNVPASLFVPPPKVDSAVLRLKIRENPAVHVTDEKMFFRVVKAAFSQRRKTLLNCLCSNFSFPKEEMSALLEGVGITPSRRGETLSLQEFADISDAITQKTKQG